MALCASCGLQLSGEAALCPHHHCVYGDDWAVANRMMCDFLHRKWVPPRFPHAGLGLEVVLALDAAGLRHIRVNTENDTVFLGGTVGSFNEEKHAKEIALSVRGVRVVINHLTR